MGTVTSPNESVPLLSERAGIVAMITLRCKPLKAKHLDRHYRQRVR